MAEIRVDFLLGSGILSRAIARFGAGSPPYWSHCASVLADGRYLDARDDRIAGVEPGVHIRYPTTERSIRRVRATKEVSQATYDDWEANLRAKITTHYGESDIVNFFTGHAKHIAGEWVCSALMINAQQHVKIVRYPLPCGMMAHQVTPNAEFLLLAQADYSFTEQFELLPDPGADIIDAS